jgi:hypothetical protein
MQVSADLDLDTLFFISDLSTDNGACISQKYISKAPQSRAPISCDARGK